MPYHVTIDDVNGSSPSGASEFEVAMVLAVVDTADACLTGAGVGEDIGKLMKVYAARHMLTLAANGGAGNVTQQSSASGASRSFAGWAKGRGINSTAYGALLAQLDKTGCLTGLVAGDSGILIRSVGPARQ